MTDISHGRCDDVAAALRRVAMDHMVGGGVEGEAANIITALRSRLTETVFLYEEKVREANELSTRLELVGDERGALVAKLGRQTSEQFVRADNAESALAEALDSLKELTSITGDIFGAIARAEAIIAKHRVCNAPDQNLATPLQRPDKEAR